MHLVYDFDYIKYTLGSVCEKRYVDVTHKATGKTRRFKNRTEFWGHHSKKNGGWLAELNRDRDSPYTPEDFNIVDVQEPEPIEYALKTVKSYIKNVCEKLGATSYYGYIGKGDSWRVEASTIMQYKGQRAANLRPILMPQIEEYLMAHHRAKIVTHLEADDQLVIDCTADKNLCAIGVDKDYMGCSLILFNPDKMQAPQRINGLGKLYLDDKGDVRGYGRMFLYYQVLSGDSSDNYKANSATSKKWGEKSAYKLLADAKTDKEALEGIVAGYKKLYPEPSRVIGWRGYEDPATMDVLKPNAEDFAIDVDWLYVMQENFTMAHMLRTPTDKFEVVPLLDKLGIDYKEKVC